MNARVLELLKNPDLIRNEDLNLLNAEIQKQPYIQNIRALYLYGTHQFLPENYQQELSRTAAYTTDKKILYQFINKIQPKVLVESKYEVEEVQPEKVEMKYEISEKKPEITSAVETSQPVYNDIQLREFEPPKPVYINGELNRILFEGEEDFLNQKTEKIDLNQTLESGTIVTQKAEIQEVVETEKVEEVKSEELTFEEIPEAENLSKETVINVDEIKTEEPVVENSAEVSFHGTEDFMPEVKIAAAPVTPNFTAPKPQVNRHEEEMKRLIAEVEAKMKASKKEIKVIEKEEITPLNTEINFAETHDFKFPKPEEKIEEAVKTEVVSEKGEITQQEIKTSESEPTTVNTSWKPMSFGGNTPDSLILKPETVKVEKVEASEIKEEPKTSEVSAVKTDEKPAMNISFFTQNVAPIETSETKEEPKQEIQKTEPESNVPGFINTWQSWLKIDRSQPKVEEIREVKDEVSEEETKEEIKTKAIETFIEKEPKISKLKEDNQFVVKEKADDISHLMTETLAKLYVEQKLYTKAIKAYETLSSKHPEKAETFKERIKEIKELRQNK
ncbi:hypothetical protein [uncultured Chryseobacterium sp.]|uniref:hypothetical protein n=1 Tax=uncultured Chryseobacterium sp. TaxID=259322 RepID=UPI00262CE763|nr:hypothetical protein [uncultured Chryseobacterium sp.]